MDAVKQHGALRHGQGQPDRAGVNPVMPESPSTSGSGTRSGMVPAFRTNGNLVTGDVASMSAKGSGAVKGQAPARSVRGVAGVTGSGAAAATSPVVQTTGWLRVKLTTNNAHRTRRWSEGHAYRQIHKSAGAMGYTGTKRGTTYVTEQLTSSLRNDAASQVSAVHILLDGSGRGRSVVPKLVEDCGITVLSVSDVRPPKLIYLFPILGA